MNLFQEMEVNYKDFIESANDFMDSCREYKNNNEDEILDNIQVLKFFHDKCISEKSIGMMQVYRVDELAKAIEEVLNLIEKLRNQNKKYTELIIKLRNLSSGVVSYEIINGKKYYGPRKNFSKQRLYEQFLKMKLLLKSEYIFLSNEDYLKELEKE